MIMFFTDYEVEDCKIALQAAAALCARLKQDVAILMDLSVVPLYLAEEIPLEIIKYERADQTSN